MVIVAAVVRSCADGDDVVLSHHRLTYKRRLGFPPRPVTRNLATSVTSPKVFQSRAETRMRKLGSRPRLPSMNALRTTPHHRFVVNGPSCGTITKV